MSAALEVVVSKVIAVGAVCDTFLSLLWWTWRAVHAFRRSAFLVLLCILFQNFKLCSSEIPSIMSIYSTTAPDMHKIKVSKLNAAYFV